MYANEDDSLGFVCFLFEKMRIILLESEFGGWEKFNGKSTLFQAKEIFCWRFALSVHPCLQLMMFV